MSGQYGNEMRKYVYDPKNLAIWASSDNKKRPHWLILKQKDGDKEVVGSKPADFPPMEDIEVAVTFRPQELPPNPP